MQGDEQMPIPAPKWRFEWNPNTVLSTAQLISLLLIGVYWVNDMRRDIREITKWQIVHEDWAKGQRDDIFEQISALHARLTIAEEELENVRVLIERNSYRLTSIEVAGQDEKAQRGKMIDTLNDQASELRVIREILSRIEDKQGGSPRPSGLK